MIAANEAKVITNRRVEDNITKAKIEVRENPSIGWQKMLEYIVEADGYEITLHEVSIKELFSDNLYWTTTRIQAILYTLGYKTKFSCSSNPANERWFISWNK